MRKYLICFFIAIILGFNIYHRSDMPPYGYPLNELSNNYWGQIIDIAHRWREWSFTFWNRETGAGLSMFASGQYPIFNPTNALAWVLNDDQFFLVKLIEPYVLGFFCMMVLLWEGFRCRWYIACFGGLAYMGLILTRSTTVVESPVFLYGCGIFPAMIFAFIKLYPRHLYGAAAGVGAVLAAQFLGEGVAQLPQLLLWWGLFLTLFVFFKETKMPAREKWITWAGANAVFVSVALGLAAVQFLPTLHYFLFESARLGGNYPVNNFPLWGRTTAGEFSVAEILWGCLVGSGPLRNKIFLVLLITCLALAVKNGGRVFANARHKTVVYLVWLATLTYLSVPSLGETLSKVFPSLHSALSALTYVNFRYALHTLDFCIVLSVCLIVNDESLSLRPFFKERLKSVLGLALVILAVLAAGLPLVLETCPYLFQKFSASPWLMTFDPPNVKKAVGVFVQGLLLIAVLSLRPRWFIRHIALIAVLLGLGFMMMLDCFKWYDKGSRNHPEKFQVGSPENDFYRRAKGKFLLPYSAFEPQWTLHNFNMVYGVYGTSGCLSVAPLRVIRFVYYYNRRHEDIEQIAFSGDGARFMSFRDPMPYALATYFPADFTIVNRNTRLDWPGFSKTLAGDQFDVYERTTPAEQVYFARRLKVASFEDVIRSFDQPRSDVMFVTEQDARPYRLTDLEMPVDPRRVSYSDFEQTKGHRITFKINAPGDVLVVVPQRYHKGWAVKINGESTPVFPAHYLFLGFRAVAGQHVVELTFVPPWFWPGVAVSVLSVAGIFTFYRRRNRA